MPSIKPQALYKQNSIWSLKAFKYFNIEAYKEILYSVILRCGSDILLLIN